MSLNFVAQQRVVGMLESQRATGRSSREVEDIASQAGWHWIPGGRVNVSIGTLINMIVLSTTMTNLVEPQTMTSRLPGLRVEALLKLGEDLSNWSFDGPSENESKFFATLYGMSNVIRPRIASLLGCGGTGTIRQLRFYSQSDIECLSPEQYANGHSGRLPRFIIDAHDLADQVRAACGTPLFIAKASSA